jgi:hypothetical protein
MAKSNDELSLLDDHKKYTAKEVAYMELSGAVKDAGCKIVDVKGGVSRQLGCCNEFQPQSEKTCLFSCGTCEFIGAKKK